MQCPGGTCNVGEMLYTENCTDSGVQHFDFEAVDNDEVLIKMDDNPTLCMERNGRDIHIQECNPNHDYQRWFTVTGGFDQYRFELS